MMRRSSDSADSAAVSSSLGGVDGDPSLGTATQSESQQLLYPEDQSANGSQSGPGDDWDNSSSQQQGTGQMERTVGLTARPVKVGSPYARTRSNRERSAHDSTPAVSLRLRQMRMKALRRWGLETSAEGDDDEADLLAVQREVQSDIGRTALDALRRFSKEDFEEIWDTAAELEQEVMLLHESVESFRVTQEEFDEERTAQEVHIRELQEKLAQVEAFWRRRLRGAEHELNETERRLLQTPLTPRDVAGQGLASGGEGSAELEERQNEIYSELLRAQDELSRLQKEKLDLKSDLAAMAAKLKHESAVKTELEGVSKKYEALKVRAGTLQNKLLRTEGDLEVLSESMLEYEAKTNELENLLQEHRDREQELARHLDALRSTNTTLVPDSINATGFSGDLFQELLAAQPAVQVDDAKGDAPLATSAGSALHIPKELNKMGTHIQSAFTVVEKPIVSTESAAAVSIAKEFPLMSKTAAATVVIQKEKVDDVLKAVVAAGTTATELKYEGNKIHIHLHQHHHTHTHRHSHQHDHVHYCNTAPATDDHKVGNGVTSALAKIGTARRQLAEVVLTGSADKVLPPKDLGVAENKSGVAVSNSRLRPVLNAGGSPKKVPRTAPLDDSGLDASAKAFTYSSSRFTGRYTDHGASKEENSATRFVRATEEAAAKKVEGSAEIAAKITQAAPPLAENITK
eukprot:Lankesteria_metandrocarpae@DN2734_c0_g1_i1.p1